MTTIHTIVSGIIKLSRFTVLSPDRKIYRGLGGMLMPDQFWDKDEFGCRGGVKFGMLSATTQWHVALNYSTSTDLRRASLFEIEVDQINRGACISWLSQFPMEEEVLIPPLSNLEVVGDPRCVVFQSNASGCLVDVSVVVIPLRLSVNLRSKTIEELITNRKGLHIATVENLIAETRRELLTFLERDEVECACGEYIALLNLEKSRPASYFNDDKNFRMSNSEMMDVKMGTIEKQRLLQHAKQTLRGNARLCDRENEPVEVIKKIMQTEIKNLRGALGSALTNLLLDDDNSFLRSVPERLKYQRMTANARRVKTGRNLGSVKLAMQACEFDDLLEELSALYPDLGRLLEDIDMIGTNKYAILRFISCVSSFR